MIIYLFIIFFSILILNKIRIGNKEGMDNSDIQMQNNKKSMDTLTIKINNLNNNLDYLQNQSNINSSDIKDIKNSYAAQGKQKANDGQTKANENAKKVGNPQSKTPPFDAIN